MNNPITHILISVSHDRDINVSRHTSYASARIAMDKEVKQVCELFPTATARRYPYTATVNHPEQMVDWSIVSVN